MLPMIIGSFGVFLLLLAFGLNLVKKLSESSPVYLGMNAVGALMAAGYAYDGGAIPFVILELTWAVVAATRLTLVIKKGSR